MPGSPRVLKTGFKIILTESEDVQDLRLTDSLGLTMFTRIILLMTILLVKFIFLFV